ncbi:MAG TPA: hypothetical protein VGN09_11060 [Vicinamibacteria bacterium]|jgi:hypothetical protein
MPKDDAPKSAYELAMERLRKKDRDEGVQERALTAAQRKAIAEARQIADAHLAEREILHASKMRGVLEPEAREALEQEYRRDRERIISDRDRKIEDARRGKK